MPDDRRRCRRPHTALRLTLGLLLLLGTSCSRTADFSETNTLTVLDYYTDEPDNTQTTTMLNACGRKLGVHVERQSVPGPQLMPKVLQQASSRTMPDLLMLNNPNVAQVAETGALTPLEQLGISTEGYVDGHLGAARYQGKTYALGQAGNTLALFYNQDLLAQAGLRPPQTWAELAAAAQQLATGDRYGVAFAAPADYEAVWQFLPFVWSNGGDETHLNHPEAEQALQFWTDLVRSGAASRSVVNWRQADVKDQFVAGKAAMMVNGPWQIPALNESSVNWGVTRLPVPHAGDTPVAPLGGEMWAVPVAESHQDTSPERVRRAVDVLRCLLADQQVLTRAKQSYQVPTRVDLARDYAREVPEMATFVEQVRNGRALTGLVGTRFPALSDALYQAIQAALTGQQSPRQALRAAQQAVEQT